MGRGKRKDWLLITCEHGGNRVPPRYAGWFRGYEAMLETHRGFDFGALQMGRELSRSLEAPLVASTVTRLLVDLNRSMGRRDLLSPASRQAPPAERERMLREHYRPYRERVEHLVGTAIARGRRVVHVSSHSFTPRLHGKVRRADVGLLCDASRSAERTTCEPELSLLGERRRTHVAPAQAPRAERVRRHRARNQSGPRHRIEGPLGPRSRGGRRLAAKYARRSRGRRRRRAVGWRSVKRREGIPMIDDGTTFYVGGALGYYTAPGSSGGLTLTQIASTPVTSLP
jgi:hypothetical protein